MNARHGPYTRCPACHVVGPPESLEYTSHAEGGIDWRLPVHWRCCGCGHQRPISADSVHADDTQHQCPRCGQLIACPAQAGRVVCGNCGGLSIGPAARTDRGVRQALLQRRHA